MLTIIIPLIFLMTISMSKIKSWITTIISLFFITLISLLYLPSDIASITASSIIDILSSILITLRIFITALIILARIKNAPTKIGNLYIFLILTLLITLIWCFSSSILLSFYVWFEASLIPTIFIIILFGYQPERLQARIYLILYTITASLPILIIFFTLINKSYHQCLSIHQEFIIPSCIGSSTIYWFPLIIGFLVKLPIFSIHLWLPKAHVEAPIAGSIVLAAILLKLGGYGLARIITIFYKSALINISPILIRIRLCGAVVTRFLCLRQPDLKSLIAYSSVGHIGIILAGISTNTKWGLCGGIIIIVAHGLCSSGLFVLANISYEVTNTRSINLTKGILTATPILSIWWFLFVCANIAAPPSINLLREIILITSVLSISTIALIPLGILRFLTAAYSLFIYSSTQHGHIIAFTRPIQNIKTKDISLLTLHFIPLLLLITKPEIVRSWLW